MLGQKINLGKVKKTEIIPSIFSNHNTMRLGINYRDKNCRKHKHVEPKQYTTKQPMNHWRNQRRNLKIPGEKWKCKHNNLKSMNAAEAVLRGKFIAIKAYLRKQEKSQIT